ncbi:trifunctional transcriptional regulator/proline dehydrogenase/L-glutamate gamma-semialdehyde dehydrogenase [Undibacterium cyanobacteriorum]|uniref:Bifunctional protein PutA n=1 Tax=Undibacterium cyanobacteriorum TaxID=3073561 RepID=A0ABY9RKW4_9BURK|nr:trifunctional transcriptional regulator/proline dehydrogenase/L-glutamate gamma-semialdehyde dehydrogenase [Undibacterium sp. 20NA77.5]WMW80997.1 trifunctional transcriptional regulator/proline dehydrogenase/L-glutamate gamma-semialdehyde dehydrogenase [Undibacterium sp. 20NA77.5]
MTTPSKLIPFDALQQELLVNPTPLRNAITEAYRRDEAEAVQWLLSTIREIPEAKQRIHDLARTLVTSVRQQRTRASGVDALMHEFSLSSEEGVALMCLAEALLRIPDAATKDRLIADKISKGDWRKHLGESPSLFVNAATWGLLVTGKLVATTSDQGLGSALTRLIAKGGEPLIRKGVDLAMRMLGNQFVTGQTIEEALKNSQDNEARGYRYSYDMLGEAALTMHDAAFYYKAYETAIHAIGKASNGRGIKDGPGISVKLSALHPRYSRAQRARTMNELLPLLKNLLVLAKQYNIGLNIDAEETDRLELSLDLMEALAFDKDLDGFEGIGFVVQAYQKRCPFVIDYLIDLARRSGRKFMVRLVKGAYWDSEIKRAQVDGMPGFPVYTRKVYTDVSYLTCAQKLLSVTDVIYPQFATHNALTLATIYAWAQDAKVTDYEFQCLHGMGETLYDQVVGADKLNKPCRIYAPVGSHQTLLAYLVRRLLENGANSSFVNQIVDEKISIDSLIEDPVAITQKLAGKMHSGIQMPQNLFGSERKNSAGMDFSNELQLQKVSAHFSAFNQQSLSAGPLLAGSVSASVARPVLNPADHSDVVGQVIEADAADVQTALAAAEAYAPQWQNQTPAARAACLFKAGDLLEAQTLDFMALAIREAGKSLPNALAEVREAVDFLRYYAAQVENQAQTEALGPVVCISPWNFPLAIFIGEVSAALAAGNVVLAKPAEQTPLIAHRAIKLMHEAGVPVGALQFLPGTGEVVGAQLVSDSRVKGVIFTGSTEVAQIINRTLAKRSVAEGHEIPLIAETGGQNAMIVDSSALPEQVVNDVLTSAFDSAGQRCSALRVLCLQEDIADKTLEMLRGAMQELRVGIPDRLATDIGPVIDAEAQKNLQTHIDAMRGKAKSFYSLELPAHCKNGTFVAPTVMEIGSLSELTKEVFGPVLHVLRYQRDQLPALVDAINATGFGLTLGVHSRIDETINFITQRAHVGNIYVNRNIVGAVVGVQPFGGEGKSGTGPKAGGPLYLKRLQKNATVNFAGNAVYDKQAPGTLDALTVWAKANGYADVAALAEQYARQNPYKMMMLLPGPTGETNTLSFVARGRIFCAANDLPSLLNQVAAAVATGNTVVVEEKTKGLLPANLPAVVQQSIVWGNADDVQFALLAKDVANEYKLSLAQQSGALVCIAETDATSEIPLWRLLAERALCVNTTAAGGNASLMSLQS